MNREQLAKARTFAEELVTRSGERIRAAHHRYAITRVGPSYDVTTDLDIEDEKKMIREIGKAYPDHSVLGEESGGTVGDEPTWILDSIDGTKYYVRNVPLYCSVAALQIGNDVVVGAIYNPRTNELYSAAQGLGATMNGRPIAVSKLTDLEQAMVDITNPTMESLNSNPGQSALFERLASVTYRVRDLGHVNYGLCQVAAGGFDAYVNILGLKKGWWDAAAGICIATEAGARAVTFHGAPVTIAEAKQPFIVAPPQLIEPILQALSAGR